MSQEKRARARIKGISVAAKVATVGGIAVAAIALVEARAAASAPRAPTDLATEASADDTARPSAETLFKVSAGNCGCAPCWGPPAPPAKTLRESRAA
jgi:hypothetical protein